MGVNKLVLYNGLYEHFIPQMEFIYNYNDFEVRGKHTNNIYYFKNGTKNVSEKIDNLVYVNYAKLTSSNKDDFIKKLKNSGVLDIEYDSIVIEKGYYKKIIEEIKNIFKQKENCIIIESPYYFSEKILLVIDAIINQKQIEVGGEIEYEE